jgi:acyl carrier protein
MTDIERWITDYFQAQGEVEGLDDDSLLDVNYFEHELLDSLGIVQLIVGIEDDFGVRLEPENMQDPRFCTIRGLGEIITELRT